MIRLHTYFERKREAVLEIDAEDFGDLTNFQVMAQGVVRMMAFLIEADGREEWFVADLPRGQWKGCEDAADARDGASYGKRIKCFKDGVGEVFADFEFDREGSETEVDKLQREIAEYISANPLKQSGLLILAAAKAILEKQTSYSPSGSTLLRLAQSDGKLTVALAQGDVAPMLSIAHDALKKVLGHGGAT